MSVLYGELADYYELIIQKDTGKEVEFLDEHLREGSVLDMACGNGRHSCALKEKGYEPVGVDISDEMVEKARQRCDAEFSVGNVLDLDLDRKFDNAIMMWSTVNLFQREGVEKIIETAYSHLGSGGRFLLDVRKYPGDGSETGEEVVENEEVRIETEVERDYAERRRESVYRYTVRHRDSGETERFVEKETSYYYSREQFLEMLESTGFEVEVLEREDGKRLVFLCEK
ncbi:MAG: class I SAM-dependent methyltransferase [Candidatus Nanohaloarchaea archaeon]